MTDADHRRHAGFKERTRVDAARAALLEAVTPHDRTERIPLLEADGRVQAAFDGYTALACPAPASFPYTYRREADKRIHVLDRDGREVGVYGSIRFVSRGKGMHSRTCSVPQIQATVRSTPRPKPLCGKVP